MSKRKRVSLAVAMALLAGVTAGAAFAQNAEQPQQARQAQQAPQKASARLEVTMTLLPENAKDAREITRKIELPPAGQPGAAGKRPADVPGADHGQGEGLEKAAEARERGREFGQDVAEQARENRENAGRRNDPPGPPANRPGNGVPPEVPVRPKP